MRRQGRLPAVVVLVAALMALSAPLALAKGGGGNGKACPEPTPGFGFTPTPGCGHERTPPPAECPANAPLGNINIAVPSLANVCVVVFLADGQGRPVCPKGTIEVPVTDVPGVAAACVTALPT